MNGRLERRGREHVSRSATYRDTLEGYPRNLRRRALRAMRAAERKGCSRCGAFGPGLLVARADGAPAVVCRPCARPGETILAATAELALVRTPEQAADRQWFLENPDADVRVRALNPGEADQFRERLLLRAAQLGLASDEQIEEELWGHDHAIVVKLDGGRACGTARLNGLSPTDRAEAVAVIVADMKAREGDLFADESRLNITARIQCLNVELLNDVLMAQGINPGAWRNQLRADVEASRLAPKN